MKSVSVQVADCGTSSIIDITNGGKGSFTIKCHKPLSGTNYDGRLNVAYTITETGLSHKNVGRLASRIE